MESTNPSNNESICPFLGLAADESTAMAYPSTQNYCYRVHPKTAPGAAYQRKFCLDAAHAQCPVYLTVQTDALPAEMMNNNPQKTQKKNPARVLILVALVLAIGAAVVWLLPDLSPAPASTDNVNAVLAATATHTSTSKPTLTPTSVSLTPTSTALPTMTPTEMPPTLTFTPLPPHMIETPIGLERKFVVHRVAEGESLNLLSETYGTTPEAIQAVNYELGPLWVNAVLVIPLGQSDVSGVLPMSAYAITADGITVEELAVKQNVDAALLCELNALPRGYLFHINAWVLIPHGTLTP